MAANTLVLDSRFRDSGTVDDYIITIFSPVKEIRGLQLQQAIMPKSSYPVITGFNDTLDFDYNSAGPFTAVLVSQNYSGAQLATSLKALMDAATSTTDFTVTYSAQTKKITIVTVLQTFDILAQTTTPGIVELLGFTTASSGVNTDTSDELVNTSYPLYLHLDIDLFLSQGFGDSTWSKHNSHSFVIPYGDANFCDFENFTRDSGFQMIQSASFANARQIRVRLRPPGISTANDAAPSNWSLQGVDHILVFRILQNF